MPVARLWASLLALLAIAGPVWAQEESVHLDYDASAGCPGRGEFIAEVKARTTRARFVDETTGVRTFKATIRSQGERATGSLLSNSAEAGAERRVSGKTCSEVVSALALITALAIDPSASTAVTPAPPPEKPKTAPAPTQAAEPSVPIGDVRTGSLPWTFGIGGKGLAFYGYTASKGDDLTMFGGSVHAEVGLGEPAALLLRASFLVTRSPTLQPEGAPPMGAASFALLGGRLSVSPLNIALSNSFELHPWLSAEAGKLKGTGTKVRDGLVQQPGDESVLWVAVGQSLEGRWHLGRSLWIELELGAVEPLYHQTFVFRNLPNPPTNITSVPYLGGFVGIGLGGRIL